jgi:hypothetical protein
MVIFPSDYVNVDQAGYLFRGLYLSSCLMILDVMDIRVKHPVPVDGAKSGYHQLIYRWSTSHYFGWVEKPSFWWCRISQPTVLSYLLGGFT